VNQDGVPRTAFDLLAHPEIGWDAVCRLWPELTSVSPEIGDQLTTDARYQGYLKRQRSDVAAYRKDERLALPADLDYAAIGSLSNEVREKLRTHRPATLGQASRIPGMTPAALVALLRFARRAA
jgi:tRNA uridine 5-carboxymethylaminomethyl modification enzyme